MKLVLVCGPWSSGTTAVSGMLEQFGLNGLGPFFQTNDVRMKNSFESNAFREVIDALASDETLKLLTKPKEAVAALRDFRSRIEAQEFGAVAPDETIFLKYPLSALLIPQLCQAFEARLIYVLRPLKAIEATRLRRGWGPNFGAVGAEVLYSRMFQVLVELPIPTQVLRYPELQAAPLPHARQIAAFCGLKPDAERLAAAVRSVRTA